jgi:cytochrome c oxidase accessory protein FixG
MSNINPAGREALRRKVSATTSYAGRVAIYPKGVSGIARDLKWAVLLFCLTVYYTLPWVRWDRGPGRPDQALLLDFPDRRFYIFSIELWPQDIYLLTGALICAAVGLFLVTSLFGRIWCGYACPQTVWTDLFMWVERRIEGDRNERMRRDAAPPSFDRVWRKLTKHTAWLVIAFWTGGAWIMYFVDAPTITREFWHGNAGSAVYGFTFLFTATTYLLAGWAREQVCTYMCPWPRFQASMLDEQSLIVTYQAHRGEPRGHRSRHDKAAAARLGECIDCRACMHVCPTGIDIRDGVQLECINCGLCIDACNEIMQKSGGQEWLIAWDTLSRQKAKAEGKREPLRIFRARTVIYVTALLVVMGAMTAALVLRPVLGLSVLHDRAPLFVKLKDGALRNGYIMKVVNKSQRSGDFVLAIEGLQDAELALAETDEHGAVLHLPVPADSIGTFRVFASGRPTQLHDGQQSVTFTLHEADARHATSTASVFLGPGEPVR